MTNVVTSGLDSRPLTEPNISYLPEYNSQQLQSHRHCSSPILKFALAGKLEQVAYKMHTTADRWHLHSCLGKSTVSPFIIRHSSPHTQTIIFFFANIMWHAATSVGALKRARLRVKTKKAILNTCYKHNVTLPEVKRTMSSRTYVCFLVFFSSFTHTDKSRLFVTVANRNHFDVTFFTWYEVRNLTLKLL